MHVRDLTDAHDYRACVELQGLTWGRAFRELVPPAILKISQKVGGIAAGAFSPEGEMVGFVYGITGWKEGKPCHWSHMLAVTPQFRDRGIGRQLKAFQKARLVDEGVQTMYWTFDPLVARNAHFNLGRLGVTIREYVPDMYGPDDDNSLDHVIGTDRFIVEWDLMESEPADRQPNLPAVELTNARVSAGDLDPTDLTLRDHASVGIAIPRDIHGLKATHSSLATRWRANTRQAFQHYLGAGYVVTGFRTDPTNQFGVYVLSKRDVPSVIP